jgi:hypothetical protein
MPSSSATIGGDLVLEPVEEQPELVLVAEAGSADHVERM